ncbi:MAG: hypothetical protein JKX71_10095 [Amylibacter sp.]|nr:hypothetical protein [Amylibacter sp.]
MIILRYIGYAAFLLAVVTLVAALNLDDILLLAPSIALALSGVVFIAFDKVITTLCEIRDLLKIEPNNKEVGQVEASEGRAGESETLRLDLPGDIKKLEDALSKAKSKH